MTLREGPSANPDACSAAADVGVLVIHATAEGVEPPSSRSRFNAAARVSNQGLLPIELAKYLSLLDWTGRELRARCRGTIPGQLATILERLGLNSDGWLETVRHFGRWFKRAAGHHDSMAALAERSGRQWFQSQRAAAIAFR